MIVVLPVGGETPPRAGHPCKIGARWRAHFLAVRLANFRFVMHGIAMKRKADRARRTPWPLLAALGLGWPVAGPAAAHDASIGVRVESGLLGTYLAEAFPPVILSPERVFPADFFDTAQGVISDEPSYLADDPSPLVGSLVGVRVRRAARAWNGSDFLGLSPLTLTISAPGQPAVTTPILDPQTPILGPALEVPAGSVEFRFDTTLNGTTPGLYLLELDAWTDAPGVGGSLPYWIVLNHALPEIEVDRGVEWVRENLVPTPGAGVVMLAGAARVSRRRRT